MVRAPCCEKVGLKKGPWTPEEDQLLINYIQQNGHGNWRALPKHAGLLRCGKSCRLRWINYLRPDIKRGNFTREEEDTIIQLHEMLGNRWSAIAAKLPGRTDNEIKNVWHTHLKKRPEQNHEVTPSKIRRRKSKKRALKLKQDSKSELEPEFQNFAETEGCENRPISPPSQQCSSDITSVTTGEDMTNSMPAKVESSDEFLVVDENFWSEVLSADNSGAVGGFPAIGGDPQPHIPFSPLLSGMEQVQYPASIDLHDSMDFWYNLLTRAEQEITELPKI